LQNGGGGHSKTNKRREEKIVDGVNKTESKQRHRSNLDLVYLILLVEQQAECIHQAHKSKQPERQGWGE
jgi:hypothetical protein